VRKRHCAIITRHWRETTLCADEQAWEGRRCCAGIGIKGRARVYICLLSRSAWHALCSVLAGRRRIVAGAAFRTARLHAFRLLAIAPPPLLLSPCLTIAAPVPTFSCSLWQGRRRRKGGGRAMATLLRASVPRRGGWRTGMSTCYADAGTHHSPLVAGASSTTHYRRARRAGWLTTRMGNGRRHGGGVRQSDTLCARHYTSHDVVAAGAGCAQAGARYLHHVARLPISPSPAMLLGRDLRRKLYTPYRHTAQDGAGLHYFGPVSLDTEWTAANICQMERR